MLSIGDAAKVVLGIPELRSLDTTVSWDTRMFIDRPRDPENTKRFWDKLCTEARFRRTEEFIWVSFSTSQLCVLRQIDWYRLLPRCRVCITMDDRAILYRGCDEKLFAEVFSEIGWVIGGSK